MNSEAIRELLARRPFEPFEVRLTNGDVHLVNSRESMIITTTRLVIADPETDRITISAPTDVASISFIDPISA